MKINNLHILTILIIIFANHLFGKDDDVYRSEYYIKEYPKFYLNRYDFEFEENTKKIGRKNILNIIKNDSSNYIPLYRNNYDPKNLQEIATLRIIQIARDEVMAFLFYKRYNNIYYSKEDIPLKIVEYEYPIELDGRKKVKVITFKQNNLEERHKGYYIIWSSKPANGNDEGLNKELNIASVYMWGINKSTDTITTNLSLKTIKKMYPEFDGVYNFKKYKSIEVDYQYTTMDDSFFKHIKFNE